MREPIEMRVRRYFESVVGSRTTLPAVPDADADESISLGCPSGRPNAPAPQMLVAIVHVDVVGYSRLIELDPEHTISELIQLREEIAAPKARNHGGRIVHSAGDSVLATFGSITGAVRFSVDLQRATLARAEAVAPERQIKVRVGIHIGDVFAESGDVHGDGVNVAARLQTACPVGAICVSGTVRDHVANRLDLDVRPMGTLRLKNIGRPVQAFVVAPRPGPVPARADRPPRLGARRRKLAYWAAAASLVLVLLGPAPILTRHLPMLQDRSPQTPNSALWRNHANLGFELLMSGQYQDAAQWLERALLHPDLSESARGWIHIYLASAEAWMGNLLQARREVDEAMRLQPALTARGLEVEVRYSDNPIWSEQWRKVVDGLRRAGLRDHIDEREDPGTPSIETLRRSSDDARSPTPMMVPGAKTILTDALVPLIHEVHPLLLDTSAYRFSLPSAVHLNMDPFGNVHDENEEVLRRKMHNLLGDDLSHPIVVFGWNAANWHARNMVLRLVALGYTNVYWYRGGKEAWEVNNLPEAEIVPDSVPCGRAGC
jgi:class 3 adenylate cyclase/rhodanese-related sulfurtransferase